MDKRDRKLRMACLIVIVALIENGNRLIKRVDVDLLMRSIMGCDREYEEQSLKFDCHACRCSNDANGTLADNEQRSGVK